jgi:hypothetical protein
MGSYWSVPYLTKKSVLIEPAVKHDTTEVKKAMDAESVKEMVANDMLYSEPFVEIEEKRALTPIIEEKTQSIETQTDVVEPVIEPVVEPVVEVKVEVKEDAKVEPLVQPLVQPVAEVQPVVQPVVAVEPVVKAESIPDLSSAIAPQFNSVSHAIKKSNKKNRRH